MRMKSIIVLGIGILSYPKCFAFHVHILNLHEHSNSKNALFNFRKQDSEVGLKKKGGILAAEDGDAESKTRRQLLFSLLASSAISPVLSPTESDAIAAEVAVVTATEEESIADAFKTAAAGKLIIPPMDSRKYEQFQLPNGLKVIICSDPSSNTAAAAMNVHVGAASDPDKVPGLAHFNEHMLFLGTKQYPEEGSFESYLSENGGSSNAFTDSENTVYFFDMSGDDAKKLSEGVDRFGSFFTDPLFTETATGRELNAIESENAKNLQSDVFRLYQIEKSRSNTKHPYSKFYTGNKATLLDDTKKNKIDLRAELIKFWSTYYTADQMTVAIVAPQPLSLLKEMATNAFGEIPVNVDKSGMKPEAAWVGKIAPFAPGTSVIPGPMHIVEAVPVADLRQVTLTWPIVFSSVQDKEYQFLDKPAFYASFLLGHEGPNSLLSFLKKQGWANGLGASTDADLSDFYTFEVTVQLTEKGMNNIDSVIEAIFSYIRLLREAPIPKYIFEETLQLSELEWRFLTPGAPGQFAQSLAQNAQKYPQPLTIAGPRRLALRVSNDRLIDSNKPRVQFDSELQFQETLKSTSDLVSKLCVDKALITVVSKSFDGRNNKYEKWYGTRYNVKPISASSFSQWTNCRRASDLGFGYPRPNVFIPEEKGLRLKKPVKKKDETNGALSIADRLKPILPPQVIRDDGDGGRWTVYYKQDETFGQPKAYAVFELLTKDAYSTAKKAALASLYQVSANDRLQEYAYDAGLAGLTYDIQVLPRGVRLTFGGYNDKILDFATYVSKKLSADVNSLLPDSCDEFERYRDEIVRAFQSFDVQQPYSHAIYFTNLMLQPKAFQYTNAEMREAIGKVSLDDLSKYVTRVWDSGKVEALLQGNIDKNEVLQFVDVIDKTLGFKTIPAIEIPAQLKALPVPKVSPDSSPVTISTAEPNPSNKNAAVQITFQCLSSSAKAHVIVEILSSILSEKFYEDLRTKQQVSIAVRSLLPYSYLAISHDLLAFACSVGVHSVMRRKSCINDKALIFLGSE